MQTFGGSHADLAVTQRGIAQKAEKPQIVECSACNFVFFMNADLTRRLDRCMFIVNMEFVAMKLGTLLHLVGLNRNTFNTMNRRTPLPFMERELRDPRSYDRYTMTHATAVGCVVEMMKAGLPANRAINAVDGMFKYVDAAVDELAAGNVDGRWWLTVINFADGTYGWVGGGKNDDTFGDGLIVNKVSINVVAVWSAMAQRLGTPIDPTNRED